MFRWYWHAFFSLPFALFTLTFSYFLLPLLFDYLRHCYHFIRLLHYFTTWLYAATLFITDIFAAFFGDIRHLFSHYAIRLRHTLHYATLWCRRHWCLRHTLIFSISADTLSPHYRHFLPPFHIYWCRHLMLRWDAFAYFLSSILGCLRRCLLRLMPLRWLSWCHAMATSLMPGAFICYIAWWLFIAAASRLPYDAIDTPMFLTLLITPPLRW